jgi:deoxyribodipyrimidine photo-lyase
MSQQDLFTELKQQTDPVSFSATRDTGLSRLAQFSAQAGTHYTGLRNYDLGAELRHNVSALSPWIRHRLISEEEVLRATLARHSPLEAAKFIQEVFWRGYFKGWLEHRPSVWHSYCADLQRLLCEVEDNRSLAAAYGDAVSASTGIACFDAWLHELVLTGYLHNHARMWFASIWIFTLRLPWQLGADFFLQHLLDGDPAANTLSWRWVAGLHTSGKHYLARAANIQKYTQGRFNPVNQLATSALPLRETQLHPCLPLPKTPDFPKGDFVLLITEEDCSVETWLPRAARSTAGLTSPRRRSPLGMSPAVEGFARSAVQGALVRAQSNTGQIIEVSGAAHDIVSVVQQAGVRVVVTPYAAAGPVADWLHELHAPLQAAGIELRQIRRSYDDLVWPHAKAGFGGVRNQIPAVLRALDLTEGS